jgi:hypothetical protein
MRRMALVAIGIAMFAAAVVWGFLEYGSGGPRDLEKDRPIPPAERVSTVNGEIVVTIDATAQHVNGIETAKLETVRYQDQIRAYGTVLDLQQLTELSNGYVAALSSRQTALAKLAASKPAFERAKALYVGQGTSKAQVQAAEAAFLIDEASVSAADSRLRTLTTTAQQAWGTTLAQALIDRTPMFVSLIDRREVLLQVTLPPGVAASSQPNNAFAELADGSRAPLQFVSLATKTDPRIQGISFFYLAAAETRLLPGMSVLAFVPSDASVDGALVAPASIVWWQGRAWVYLKQGVDHFVRREIATNLPAAQGGYVVTKLASGSEVVTQGAQMLLSEEQRDRSQAAKEQ